MYVCIETLKKSVFSLSYFSYFLCVCVCVNMNNNMKMRELVKRLPSLCEEIQSQPQTQSQSQSQTQTQSQSQSQSQLILQKLSQHIQWRQPLLQAMVRFSLFNSLYSILFLFLLISLSLFFFSFSSVCLSLNKQNAHKVVRN